MVAGSYFIAQDYDLAFKLQNLFHEYVGLYTKLHYPDSENPVSNMERRELTMKVRDARNNIALHAMKMKQLNSDVAVEPLSVQQTFSVDRTFCN